MIYVLSLYIFIEKINLNTQFGLTEISVIFAYILTLKLFSYYQKLLDVFFLLFNSNANIITKLGIHIMVN